MRGLLASPLGFLVGVALGALGGGGSIIAVPALVFVAGQDPKAATSTSLVLVAATALVGVVPHWRAGRVRLGAGVVFGVTGVAGSVAGSWLNGLANEDLLLIGFGFVMLAASWSMYRRSIIRPAEPPVPDAATVSTRMRIDTATALRVILAGTAVGLMTGFFGVGGGFIIVPALVLALGFSMPEAVGTSLVVITINAVVALTQRLGEGTIEWDVAIPFTVASLIGVVVGSQIAGRVDPTRLQRVFAGLLVLVAIFTIASSAMALV